MADSTFAEHVATTNSRLSSLRANLNDASTFPEACSELTKWCQDQRAFTAHFEENLMLALEVAMDYGTRENFDYMLTHALVGACFTHRKHLSKQSATRIGRWYEQMRRLKKNGGKRKRAPPKPKEPVNIPPPPPSSVPLNGSIPPPPPVLTSPCPPNPGQLPTENNNFMFSPNSSDGSMWAPPGVPMSTPGSSAGHMMPGGAVAPYPGPMNPGPPHPTPQQQQQQQHPGMHYGQQMQLPYGQLEGNHAMYDHRMMANRAAVAGRPPGMMPDYSQMPMGQNPAMRIPVQYPPGPPQMAGHPQMQYGQMMRAPPVSVYGQINHAQQYAVTAHPNPAQPFILPEVRQLYETTSGLHIERALLADGIIPFGDTGVEAFINPESYQFLESNSNSDMLFSVWSLGKGDDCQVHFQVYVNGQCVMSNQMPVKAVCIKQYLKSGINVIQFRYQGQDAMHHFACEFVTRKNMAELRKMAISKRLPDAHGLANQQRATYAQQASKRQAGVLNVTLNCSLSKKRMFTPARHNECKKATFDLGQLINQNKNKTRYQCSSCNQYFKFDDINVDYFLLNAVGSIPAGVNDIIIDKTGQCRPGDVEENKPKRGKKKTDTNADGGAHAIKRIKSEIIVKQEPGVFPDIHGRNIPFSPMPMPGSVPNDWTRLQSPSFSMQSPNKIQLGPATPATPGMIFQNPASAGSMLNMGSPRQTMMPGGAHPMMPPHDPSMAMRSGSAPYTPESVKNDKNDELLIVIQTPELYRANAPNIFDNEQLVGRYMDGTKDDNFEDSLVYEFAESPKQQQQLDQSHTLMAPGSSSSSSGSTFTPPFDDIHLGNRASH